MRLVIESLVLLLVLSVFFVVREQTRQGDHEEADIRVLRESVQIIERHLALHRMLDETALNAYGHPETVDPAWFDGDPPVHPLVPADHPWVEVAPRREWSLHHPRQRVIIDGSVAAFWYNPARGIVRARVPQQISDERTLEIYNRVNDARLRDLFTPVDLTIPDADVAPAGEP